jgi:hypothetical protein
LAAAQKAVVRAETARPGASFLTATVTESNAGVTLLKPTRGFLDAYYDPFSGEIEIEAGEIKNLGRGLFQGRLLTLAAALPGEGAYTLSLTNAPESYAYYERATARNINADYPDIEFQEFYSTVDFVNQTLGSGTLTITLAMDTSGNWIAWGTFTLAATGSEDPTLQVSMTGSFLVRPEVFDDYY